MKKLLLSTAVAGLAFAAAPAHADIDLELGGYFTGYGVFNSQDDATGTNSNDFDFLRDTELHVTGETTLDNGLTVGAHMEFDVDGNDGSAGVDESYAYFSGDWGRVNFGEEDGAAYLLQVAAPSADSNLDGLRQLVQPNNYSTFTPGLAAGLGIVATTDVEISYDQDNIGSDTKLTYLSPVFSGFQVGLSYSADSGAAGDLDGVGREDDVANSFGSAYEAAVRYEGQFNNVGFNLGAGFTHQDLENRVNTAALDPTDDRQAWNLGADFDIGPFGVGVVYLEDDYGDRELIAAGTTGDADEEEVFVLGADYTTGPFKIGASYYDADNHFGVDNLETERYTGGVVYTYGPGMTFRGSVSYIEHDLANIGGAGDNSVESTSVLLGTQVKF